MAKRFTAHEIAMSIKEMRTRKDKRVKQENDSRKMNEQIASLRALVKELADALDRRVCRIKDCRTECGAGMGACIDIDHRELVDKAREVCK